jgi:GDP-4-dehydro-6-deoxy-D-mannose reductase
MSGFVGSYCEEAIESAVALTRNGAPADLTKFDEIAAALASIKPDAVIHLAAQSSVAVSLENPRATYEVNFLGTMNLLAALRESGFRGRFLYVSSGDCYGLVPEHELPVEEDQPLRPRSPYAVSKAAAEALCYQWSQTSPIEVVIARAFNHIGPRQHPRFVVAGIAKQLARVKRGSAPPELVVGDVDVTRDFTDVRDVVRAYVALLQHGANGEIYNVCSGSERSIRSIIEILCEQAGVPVRLAPKPDLMRPTEQRRMLGSYERLSRRTGWRPEVPIEQSLSDILEYWQKQEEQ